MRFRVMPFGMVNAGSTYNRMVRKLLEGSQNLESYVDDITGYSQNWAYHLQILRDFCERVRRAKLDTTLSIFSDIPSKLISSALSLKLLGES